MPPASGGRPAPAHRRAAAAGCEAPPADRAHWRPTARRRAPRPSRALRPGFGAGADDQLGPCRRGGVAGREVEEVARCRGPIEFLNEQLAVAAADRDRDLAGRVGAGRDQRQRRHAAQLRVPADCQAVRRGNSDADAGEASRPDPDQDAFRLAALEQLIEHGHQPLRMAAADHLVAPGDALARPVEQGCGAGRTRRVERQDHGMDSGHRRARAATP